MQALFRFEIKPNPNHNNISETKGEKNRTHKQKEYFACINKPSAMAETLKKNYKFAFCLTEN